MNNTTTLQPMLTCPAFAALVGLHPRTVTVKCRRGEIPAIKVGESWRIPRWYVEAILRGEASPTRPVEHTELDDGEDLAQT
jgi:excisionase family DNA binding protein